MHSLKFRTTRAIAVATGLMTIAACSQEQINDSNLGQFYREAGAELDTGQFGNATLNNSLVQSGERDFTYSLAQRFEAEVPAMVNFAFNSSQLDADAQAALRQQAAWIRQFPEIRFRVYGHTDKVGSNGFNKTLGLRRAQAAVSYLTTQGISRSRLEAVASFGETQPLVVTEGRERRNRRTVTQVTGFVKSHPTVLDGKYARIIYRDYVGSATQKTTVDETTGNTE